MSKSFFQFNPDGVSFCSESAVNVRTIYAPLCGADSGRIKSSITPFLGGDIKIDKFRYVTKPVSTEDLRQGCRNFYVSVKDQGFVSLADPQADKEAAVEIGPLWHKVIRTFTEFDIEMEALNFVPVTDENVELMRVRIKNRGQSQLVTAPWGAVPLFGRALANKHDHEQVTSLLNRIKQIKWGVILEPTMRFNEEGHKPNDDIYFVLGYSGQGQAPVGTFPTIADFYGDGGTFAMPQAVVKNQQPRALPPEELSGKEAAGALRFADVKLMPGETASFYMLIGVADQKEKVEKLFEKFSNPQAFDLALKENQKYWDEKTSAITFNTADSAFNSWMRWVSLQPVLRRIFGCSFLPDHDYGKGGKGWRDLWQDLLSLILIEPQNTRQNLINNFAGVRVDGSNATIIGTKPGEFVADRNAITRVWMDHGVWPLQTILLYIQQTGHYDILLEKNSYFRDPQFSRTFQKDSHWTPAYGNQLKTKKGEIYQGTILEHILVQHLVQFFNVGEHNLTRLESADWNDGLDMAFARGESPAFMHFYAGNLLQTADLMEELTKTKKIKTVAVFQELLILLDSMGESINYDDPVAKRDLLFKSYFASVQPELNGIVVDISLGALCRDLRRKAQWMQNHLRKQERLIIQSPRQKSVFFNGYYDNQGQRVEGLFSDQVRMTLTGQVFAILHGTAAQSDLPELVKSVNRFLKDPQLGGIRLNTDFKIPHYLDLGRAFGFAYGTKENGAFFSHMTVMYAYALYQRGLYREGHAVLESIYRMATDSDRAKIYPGIPEYFDSTGRGMYHYLTGSASWFVLTELTQVFGIKGRGGDLILEPKLVKEQFDNQGRASVSCFFAWMRLRVFYDNPQHLDAGQYKINQVELNGTAIPFERLANGSILIKREG
ncbi:MAG: cellobiose phosphorylase, partial [Candidatus Omnitrophica bacterium]|nr:cellobiose phosphorylase [Candidatus Omnitrophota bacterium]